MRGLAPDLTAMSGGRSIAPIARLERVVSPRWGGALALAVAMCLAACDVAGFGSAPDPGTSPSASPPPGRTANPQGSPPSPLHTGRPVLPPPNGAATIDAWEVVDEGIREQGVIYRILAPLDIVRAHYRDELRATGWKLIDAEIDDGEWELEWRQDGREIEIDLRSEGNATFVEMTLSEPAPP
jgi:hypothetical protein